MDSKMKSTQLDQLNELLVETIHFGRAAYQYKKKYGELPKGHHSSVEKFEGQSHDPSISDAREYYCARKTLCRFSEHESPYAGLVHHNRELWTEFAKGLDADNLGYLIAGMKAASEEIDSWPRGSTNLHEKFIKELIALDDQRLWKCREIPNVIEAWAYFASPDIPDRAHYFSEVERSKGLRRQKEMEASSDRRKIDLQDQTTANIIGTPAHKKLRDNILKMSPITQLGFITEHEDCCINLYPAEIAPGITREIIEQLDSETISCLARLLRHRKVEDGRWGKFKVRLLDVFQARRLQEPSIPRSRQGWW
jgi:hypothetical protein